MNNPDVIEQWLIKQGIPVTRESYLDIAYPAGIPDDWDYELESMLPLDLQDFSKVMTDE